MSIAVKLPSTARVDSKTGAIIFSPSQDRVSILEAEVKRLEQTNFDLSKRLCRLEKMMRNFENGGIV